MGSRGLDFYIQNLFFNPQAKSWFVDAGNPTQKWIFYQSPKWAIAILGVSSLAYIFRMKYVTGVFPRLSIFVLAIIFVPLILSSMKEVTGMYCPAQLTTYGGNRLFRTLFDFQQFSWEVRGKCFPAGHASGGFALMSLFFVFEKKAFRILGLAFGLAMGWTMAIYQILKGAHFLSDSLATIVLSWAIILCINYTYVRFSNSQFSRSSL